MARGHALLALFGVACANGSPLGGAPNAQAPSNAAPSGPASGSAPAQPKASATGGAVLLHREAASDSQALAGTTPIDAAGIGASAGRGSVGAMYHDPNNLPNYPCEDPNSSRESAPLALDGGTRLDSGVTVNGRLPPVVIQKRIRADFGAMRACYEVGMAHRPDLAGRITAKFIIERSGTVRAAEAICTSLPDSEVVRCVIDRFARLSFPQPEGGVVTVIYPIKFNPGD
jgi:hypothetical protein